MLDRFVGALFDADVQRSDLEVAEIMWLASLWSDVPRRTRREVPVPPAVEPFEPLVSSAPRPTMQSDPSVDAHEEKARPNEEQAELFVPLGGESGRECPTGERVGVTGSRALHHAHQISKALRPLSRRYPSNRHLRIDEEATAERIAQEKIWVPVMVPTRARWLDLAVVVDGNPSMQVWSRTIRELVSLLQLQGAFDRVRSWRMLTTKSGESVLTSGRGIGRHHLGELRDPSGRLLILVVSDCVGEAWYDKALPSAIKEWGGTQPVALLQMLPHWLWRYTALGASKMALAAAQERGVTNSNLIARPLSPLVGVDSGERVVPLFTLDPARVKSWALVVAGHGEAQSGAVFLEPGQRVDEPELSAEEKVARFLRHASPTAVRLAAIYAATPLQLPIMRAVQRAMLPESSQTHLAEVFIGGLIRRDPADLSEDPEETYYEFHPGVAEILLEAVPAPDVIDVAMRVRAFLEQHSSEYGEVLSFVTGEPGSAPAEGSVAARHFATVKRRILRRLPFMARPKEPRKRGGTRPPIVELAERAKAILSPVPIVASGRNAIIIGGDEECRLLSVLVNALGFDVVHTASIASDFNPFWFPDRKETWLVIYLGGLREWKDSEALFFSQLFSSSSNQSRLVITNREEVLEMAVGDDLPTTGVARAGLLLQAESAEAAEMVFRRILEGTSSTITVNSLHDLFPKAILRGAGYLAQVLVGGYHLGLARGHWLEDKLPNCRALLVCGDESDTGYVEGYLRGAGLELNIAASWEAAEVEIQSGKYTAVLVDDPRPLHSPKLSALLKGMLVICLKLNRTGGVP